MHVAAMTDVGHVRPDARSLEAGARVVHDLDMTASLTGTFGIDKDSARKRAGETIEGPHRIPPGEFEGLQVRATAGTRARDDLGHAVAIHISRADTHPTR